MTAARGGKEEPRQATLWVPQKTFVRPVRVGMGASDGSQTEVQGADLKEGLQVVVGEETKEGKATGSGSPFTPQLFRGSGSTQRQ